MNELAHEMVEPSPPSGGFNFDFRISLGTIITVAVMVIGGATAFTKVQDAVDVMRQGTVDVNATLRTMQTEIQNDHDEIATLRTQAAADHTEIENLKDAKR